MEARAGRTNRRSNTETLRVDLENLDLDDLDQQNLDLQKLELEASEANTATTAPSAPWLADQQHRELLLGSQKASCGSCSEPNERGSDGDQNVDVTRASTPVGFVLRRSSGSLKIE